mmetsp:Transcript_8188/g.23417  ORF Transcript_8188/g.23417 Transcript_8188/m.23417 type:complete len:204 (+) Transcript_8188:30-641(+)
MRNNERSQRHTNWQASGLQVPDKNSGRALKPVAHDHSLDGELHAVAPVPLLDIVFRADEAGEALRGSVLQRTEDGLVARDLHLVEAFASDGQGEGRRLVGVGAGRGAFDLRRRLVAAKGGVRTQLVLGEEGSEVWPFHVAQADVGQAPGEQRGRELHAGGGVRAAHGDLAVEVHGLRRLGLELDQCALEAGVRAAHHDLVEVR